MKATNVADFRKHLSTYLAIAEGSATVEVCRRNIPIARVVGIPRATRNRTVLGCGRGTGVLLGEVVGPPEPPDDGEMLRQDGA